MSGFTAMENVLSNYQFGWYSWVLLAAGVLSLLTAYVIWRRRPAVGVGYLVLLELAVANWALAIAWEAAGTTLQLKYIWSVIAYPGTLTTVLFYFFFALAYGQHERYLTRRSLILFSIIPALTLLGAVTNPWHGWVWTDITINPVTNVATYSHGWLFWVLIVYTYALVVIGVFSLLSSAFRVARTYRRQFVAILFAAIFPFAGSVIYLFTDLEPYGYDFTPIGFMLTGMVLAWSILRYRVLDLMPVARDRLVDTMSDGVIVIDSRGRVGDLNPAMEELIGRPGRAVIGQPAEQALARYPTLARRLLNPSDDPVELHVRDDPNDIFLDIHWSPLLDSRGKLLARIIVMRDITERKLLEQERARLIDELQNAVAEVKALSGLLPVCANCKSIRDDRGYWHQVEEYLEDHSDAEFTHGICPDCMQKLYAGYIPSSGQTEE